MCHFRRLCTAFAISAAAAAAPADYDLVIQGGRVLDPESGLDAPLNVGIRGGEIAAITEDPLVGAEILDASGHIVAPGFIDLHAHGQDPVSRALQAADGVTTALELEIGVYPVKPWYDAQAGTSPIHYGATVGHLPARIKVKTGLDVGHTATAPPAQRAQMAGGDWANAPATPDEIEQISALLREGLQQGALGLGYGIAYTPGATQQEIFETMKVAPEAGVPVFVHMREGTDFPLDEPLGAVQEMLANATATGASLHIVHLNSSTAKQARAALDMIRGARQRGIDVTTESYPWDAGSTRLESALFDNWGDDGEKFEDLLWVE
ncbi:MAG: amidohydrolase family protein, partial [Candidatus Hydrogenedentales bacterium]